MPAKDKYVPPFDINKRQKVAILGGRGMLGGDLVEFLGERHETFAIDKDNYGEFRGREFDALVNANGNSRRFWANQNPFLDFEVSTVSVYNSFFDFKFGKYIYISSSDVYPDHGDPEKTAEDAVVDCGRLEPYGLHKRLSEEIVQSRAPSWIILRSSMMLGRKLKKGPIFDILNGVPLFISRDSRLQMITTRAVAEIIEKLLRVGAENRIFNMGGRGAVSFLKAEEVFGRKISFRADAERQEYEMNVEKLGAIYPLKTSEEYLADFLRAGNN